MTEAVAAGATLELGGHTPEGPGFYYPPTVLTGVSSDAEILHTEIFGPVAPIVTFTTEEEAVELANNTEYGLVSYVYTADLARGLRVSERIEAGMVGLNRGLVSDPAAPFGGVKESGLGREGGVEGLLAFTETKYICCQLVTFTTDSGSIPNKWQHPQQVGKRRSREVINEDCQHQACGGRRRIPGRATRRIGLQRRRCSANHAASGGGGGGGNSGYTFAMVTHETPGDTFWDRIRAGAEQAAKDTGSTLKYSADPEATKQAVLIQNAIDSKVDGIATTLVTPDALIPTVKKAVAAGIPVDSFNSGTNFYQQAGSIAHFSSDEKLAGQQAGAKAKAAGATKILCTIQQTGSVALEDRCAGVKDAFPNTENIQVNGQDDSAVTSAIQAKLAQDKEINWIITLGATQALDALKAMDAVKSQAKLGTFDLSKGAAEAVKAGTIQFCIDQQPYLQGYLAVTQLYLYKKNGNILGGGKPSLTGPAFVDTSNVDTILPFINQNTR